MTGRCKCGAPGHAQFRGLCQACNWKRLADAEMAAERADDAWDNARLAAVADRHGFETVLSGREPGCDDDRTAETIDRIRRVRAMIANGRAKREAKQNQRRQA